MMAIIEQIGDSGSRNLKPLVDAFTFGDAGAGREDMLPVSTTPLRSRVRQNFGRRTADAG